MITGVLLPALGLIVFAVLVPVMLERWVPESVAGMIVNGVVSGLVLTVLSTGYFLWAYVYTTPSLTDLIGTVPSGAFEFFLLLALRSGLIWGPVLVLVISTSPRRWKENVW